jgi:hypothetical protein
MAAAECSVARRAPALLASGLRARTMRACAGAFMLDVACCIVALLHVAGCDRPRAQSQQVCARLPAHIRAGTQRLRWARLRVNTQQRHVHAHATRRRGVQTAARLAGRLKFGGCVLLVCLCLFAVVGGRAGGSKPCLAVTDAAPCSLARSLVCLFAHWAVMQLWLRHPAARLRPLPLRPCAP